MRDGGVLYLPLREFVVLELKSQNFGLQFTAANVTFAPGQAPGGKKWLICRTGAKRDALS